MRAERIAALEAMLVEDSNDAFALYGLGVERKVSEDMDEAEALFRRLLVVDPEHHYGYYQLGELLLDDGQMDEAETVLRDGQGRAEAAGETKAARELGALLDQC